MEKFISSLEKVLSYIYSPLIKINIVLMIIWPLTVVIYTILRFFDLPLFFVEEYTKYWLVFITYSMLAYAFRAGSHIKIDILTKDIKGISEKILETIIDLLMIFVSIHLFQRSINLFIYSFKSKATSGFASDSLLWPFYSFPIIGFALLIMEILIKTCKDLKKFSITKNI